MAQKIQDVAKQNQHYINFFFSGTMYAVEKNALLICINEENPRNKIKVIMPDVVPGGKADTEFPLLSIYTGMFVMTDQPKKINKLVILHFHRFPLLQCFSSLQQ